MEPVEEERGGYGGRGAPKGKGAKGGKDAEWTFSVDPKTKIRKNGKDITAADLAAGDNVHVRYHEDAGKNVADAVMVRAAKKPAETSKAEPKK